MKRMTWNILCARSYPFLLFLVSSTFSILATETILSKSPLGRNLLTIADRGPFDLNLYTIYTADAKLGYRPVLGSSTYNAFGTRLNSYDPEMRPRVPRILFLGDSVTSRESIIVPLKRLYGENRFEFWNAGVEGYNTLNEVEFYKRYNAAIEPDQVVLFFHNNDFQPTPVIF